MSEFELDNELKELEDLDGFFDNVADIEERKALRDFYAQSGARDNEHMHSYFKLLVLNAKAVNDLESKLLAFEARFDNTAMEQLAVYENVLTKFKDNYLEEINALITYNMSKASVLNSDMAMRTNQNIIDLKDNMRVFTETLTEKAHGFTQYVNGQVAIIQKELNGKKLANAVVLEMVVESVKQIFPTTFKKVSAEAVSNFTEEIKRTWTAKSMTRQIFVYSCSLFIAGGMLLALTKFF